MATLSQTSPVVGGGRQKKRSLSSSVVLDFLKKTHSLFLCLRLSRCAQRLRLLPSHSCTPLAAYTEGNRGTPKRKKKHSLSHSLSFTHTYTHTAVIHHKDLQIAAPKLLPYPSPSSSVPSPNPKHTTLTPYNLPEVPVRLWASTHTHVYTIYNLSCPNTLTPDERLDRVGACWSFQYIHSLLRTLLRQRRGLAWLYRKRLSFYRYEVCLAQL